MPKMKIIAKPAYGNINYYPADEISKRFAEIANTRTLTEYVLTRCSLLGFEIECILVAHGTEVQFPLKFIEELK